MATEGANFSKDNNNQGAGTIEDKVDIQIQKDLVSPEITEELTSGQYETRPNIILEIPTITQEEAREDYLRIDIPPTPSPRRVIFPPCLSPGFSRANESPGPSSSKSRSTIKTFLPKLSFKFLNTSSDIEKAAFLALEGSAPKKPFLSRTLSRTKTTTSSLPATPIAHSHPGSLHGGNMAYLATTVEKGVQLPIHRSRSVPSFTEEGNTTPVGAKFRVIPTTPRIDEKIATTTSTKSPTDDAGKSYLSYLFYKRFVNLRIFNNILLVLTKIIWI